MGRYDVPHYRNNFEFEIVDCPTCGARAGDVCRSASGSRIYFPHIARIKIARGIERPAVNTQPVTR